MKKRIYLNMLIVCIICITVISLLLSFVFYELFSNELKQQLKTSATNFAKILNNQSDPQNYLSSINFPSQDYRISLIGPDGKVLYDNYKNMLELDNHKDRPEIINALSTGQGQSDRFSSSLNKQTHYYAQILSNGQIIRIAKTTDSIIGIFYSALPYIVFTIILAFIICSILSAYLTRKIINPINALQLEGGNSIVYKELEPLTNKINHQQKQIQEQIQELEGKATAIQTIIKNMKEGLIFLDKTGNIISLNDSTCKLFKKTFDECQNKNILTLTRIPAIIEQVKSALVGEKSALTQTIDNKTVEIFFSPVLDDKGITGVLVLFLDITDKAQIEKIRREFSANVSHELKTPLTTISGISEMLAKGMIKQNDIASFACKIHDQVLHLIKLIENIIKISQLDEKLIQTDFEQFDLLDLANKTAENFKQLAQKNNITLDIIGEKTNISANKMMITELLTNLIDNAIKYNKPNGSVKVEIMPNDKSITINVTDTGIGIEVEHHLRVFERFYRVDPSRSRQTGGTGLGLSIVKNIAKYHNGSVQINSTLGKGTSITVNLNEQ